MTPRERELLEETEFTKPTDFHSFRRAYKQALANAGVELTTAMALSGATDAKAHQRYLTNTALARPVPEQALPRLTIQRASAASHSGATPRHLRSQPANDCDENSFEMAATGTADWPP